MEHIRAFSGRFFLAQGRQLIGGATANYQADKIYAFPFVAQTLFDAVGILSKELGGNSALVRAGVYDSDPDNGLPRTLLAQTDEYTVAGASGSTAPLLLPAPLLLTQPYWCALIFGTISDTPPLLGTCTTIRADMQRAFGGNFGLDIPAPTDFNAVSALQAYGPLPASFPAPSLLHTDISVGVRAA